MRVANNSALGVLAIALVALGCGEDPLVGDVPVRVEVTPSNDTVLVGETAQLSATAFNVRDEVIPTADFTWRSDQAFIAAVDSLTGLVTGVSEGVAAVTARAGLVSDTTEVFVLAALTVDLPLDTILLLPGDTFTIPVNVLTRDGAVAPPVIFSGGAASVATVDADGLVTAQAPGIVGFTAAADSVASSGGILVRSLPDTTFGLVYLSMRGGVATRGRFGARMFNHPTDDARSVAALNSETLSGAEQFAVVLLDSLSAPRASGLGTLTAADIALGTDAVCLPPTSWAFYRDTGRTVPLTALSTSGGTFSVTSMRNIPGGRALSGQFSLRLQRVDRPGSDGAVTAIGTFVIPLLDLTTCPK